MENKDWVDYWSEDNFWKDSSLWKINSELFFKYASRLVEFKKSDTVLDIGCGPGHIEALIAPLVKNVHAVDIAEQFVDMCSKRCGDKGNVSTGFLKKDDYTDLKGIQGRFSIILCISVVQYYRNISEVESLISSAKRIASPGCRMLIADLPLKRDMPGFLWDTLCSYLLSVREGYAQALLRMAFKRWFSKTSYKSFYDKVEQLYFTKAGLESLVNRLDLDARIIKDNLSVYANRLGLLIKF